LGLIMKRIALGLLLLLPVSVRADGYVLFELFEPGTTYFVDCRVNLNGELQVPLEEGGGTKKVKMKGESTIQYDERILPTEGRSDGKTLRIYRQMEFDRTVGDVPQSAALRREVSRLVVMKAGQAKVAFSPDGAMTWDELNNLRTDLFLPALGGMLPSGKVKPGDRWKVSDLAVRELTDMDLEEGKIEATLIEETTEGNRRLAHVKFSGEVKGVDEDGPAKHKLSGMLYYDLDGRYISYLSVRGEHQMLDKDKKVVGTIEGVCVLTRRLHSRNPDLQKEAVAKLKLEMNDENTLLLYENADLGVKFLHPRRWRVGRVQGRQITLDEDRGNGVLITVEPQKLLPATEQFLRESKELLTQKKAKFGAAEEPSRLAKEPSELDRFSFDVEVGGERARMDYYIARQPQGGACFAARLVGGEREALRTEVEKIARSLVVTKRLETK
jgi:hypothetical protein